MAAPNVAGFKGARLSVVVKADRYEIVVMRDA